MKAKTSISLAAAHALLSQANAAILNDDATVDLILTNLDAKTIEYGFLNLMSSEYGLRTFLPKDNAEVKVDASFMWLKDENGKRHKLRLLLTMSLLPVKAAPVPSDQLKAVQAAHDKLSDLLEDGIGMDPHALHKAGVALCLKLLALYPTLSAPTKPAPVEAAPTPSKKLKDAPGCELTNLLADNLTAWQGEEESVQEEHAELIERLKTSYDEMDARLAVPVKA